MSLVGGWRRESVLPGFGWTMGWTLFYLSLIVVFPLATLVAKASTIGASGIWAVATQPRVTAALRTSFGISLSAALIDVVFGGVIAWTLTRQRFPLRKLFDAAVDLPFALPTAVSGIALASLYAPNGWIGRPLAAIGVKIAYTRWGILVALIFVGLPFVVRTVQPIIADLEKEMEEASATLGARPAQTFFRVLLPPLIPALLTGLALAFARGVGEYGSVIFIAGNLAYVSEIAPLLVVVKLEEYDYVGATAIAAIMLGISFVMLLAINGLQSWMRKRFGDV